MVYEKPQLSLWEQTTFVYGILRALGNGFYTSLIAPFRGSSGSAKYINHVKLAIARSFMIHTTVRHFQATTPVLDEAYPAFAKKQGFTPESIELADGTKAYWLGSKDNEKVMLYFHGGGYNLPPDAGHLPFASSVVASTDNRISVLMLSYTLAPQATYPYQLRQAVELLRYVCTDLKRSPANVTIAGDSAGANLAVGVLSHMLHPHAEIPALELDGGLGAAILLAPWASFGTDWPSSTYNARKDVVSAAIGNRWSESFLGGRQRDGYNEPLAAEEEWWRGLDGVVREVLVVGGSDETLVDCIRELARRFEAVHANVVTVIAEGEWHDMPTLSILGGGGQQDETIKSFVKSRL